MKEKILIVDDKEDIRYTLKFFFEAKGYEIFTAHDYQSAILQISEIGFDLIFTDIILQGKSGIDILEQIRSMKLHCPVIIFTGVPTLKTAADAVRLGAFDYIEKPIKYEELIHVAKSALRHKLLLDEKEKYRSNLEAIFKSVKDAIITVDDSIRVIEINGATANICGISQKDAKGKSWKDLTPRCAGKCIDILKRTIAQKKPTERYRIECFHEKHPAQVVSLSAAPLENRPNVSTGAVMVIRDETRLADLEKSLKERRQYQNIIGKSPALQEIYARIEALVDLRTTVLITGKSGTGKEMVADALHFGGCRSNKPLVKVNCGALPEELLESELFGHVTGAFTGAVRDKIGRFQKANGGTLFLDEIGETSPKMQLRLLRVLQEMEFERVGDPTPIRVDTRVVAATNKDLREEVRHGRFREDLYYRLKIIELNLPPLAERKEDIPLLTAHFIKKLNQKFEKEIAEVSEDVRDLFMRYFWPGNVRELEHSLEHAFILCSQEIIVIEHLPVELQKFNLDDGADDEYQTLLKALHQTRWNKTETAGLLGVSRQSIYRRMKKYNMVNN